MLQEQHCLRQETSHACTDAQCMKMKVSWLAWCLMRVTHAGGGGGGHGRIHRVRGHSAGGAAAGAPGAAGGRCRRCCAILCIAFRTELSPHMPGGRADWRTMRKKAVVFGAIAANIAALPGCKYTKPRFIDGGFYKPV